MGNARNLAKLAVDSNGDVAASSLENAAPFSFRNRIINGDMRIDQRNAGAAWPKLEVYTVDRWQFQNSVSANFTVQQNLNGITPPPGFTNYLGIQVDTAYTSFASTDLFNFKQLVEGYNASDLMWGTADAKPVTVSFWVRSSITGTFSIAILTVGDVALSQANSSYVANYTINSANTWEKKVITIPGNTLTGHVPYTTNNQYLQLRFPFGNGSSRQTSSLNQWIGNGANYFGSTSDVQLVSTQGATFYLTGVQLETGSVATEFERRPYGMELALCQRYFQRYTAHTTGVVGDTGIAMLSNWNTTSAYTALLFQQTMRVAPSCSFSSASHFAVFSGGSFWTPDDFIVSGASVNSVEFYANRNSAAWTAGYSSWLRINNAAGYIQLSSEL